MAESLRSRVTPEIIANEFILQWKSPSYADKILVIVEGKDDRIFYYKFFNNDITEVRDCNGCKKVVDVYNFLKTKAKFVYLTIKDSDFERLNGCPSRGDNFFLADCHDYEMMCLKNCCVVKRLFDNLAIPYDGNMINEVFSDLKYISFFKWYNYTNRSNYNFRAFSVTDKSVEQLCDFDYIHQCILPMSSNCCIIDEETLKSFIENSDNSDIYELTNGHDFIKRLCYHIKNKYHDIYSNLNEEKIRNILHPCYTREDFSKTDLFKDIQLWGKNLGKDILQC